MFDWTWIDELDGNAAADELARSRDLLVAAEAGQFLLAAHWADLHAPTFVDDCRGELPGRPRAVRAGADGCPEIEEFAGSELAVLTGRTTRSGEQLVRDAVNVRHRHPQLWAGIRAGAVRVWVACKVARRCAAAELTSAEAQWVDAETTPYLMTLPLRRFFDLVDAKIIEADPEAAQARAEAAALERFVRLGMRDENGLRTLVARAHAGDVLYVVAVLDRIAGILAEQGDPDPVEARRATALRILANPARALALLLGVTVTGHDPAWESSEDLSGDLHPGGEAGWMKDAEGRWLHGVPSDADLQPLDLDDPELQGLLDGHLLPPAAAGQEGSEADSPGSAFEATLLADLLAALQGFDASRLDPVTVVHVHLSDLAVASRDGVVRVEEVGPWTMGQLRDWLSHPTSPDEIVSRMQVRPVLDASTVVPVDRYEVRGRMGELCVARTPYEVFPFGTVRSRKADKDHIEPYRSTRPPGQTRLDNIAPLSRRHHRLKTHGDWLLLHPREGEYLWRTRHGHWFRVDADGTHHLGRDEALDRQWNNPLGLVGCAL